MADGGRGLGGVGEWGEFPIFNGYVCLDRFGSVSLKPRDLPILQQQ